MAELVDLKIIKESPLWDTVSIAKEVATASVIFFKDAIGGAKTEVDTNLQQAGRLDTGFAYEVLGLRVRFNPDVVEEDAKALVKKALFRLTVAEKIEFEIPLADIPAGNGIHGAKAVTNGLQFLKNAYPLDNPIKISANITFKAEIFWKPSVTVSADSYIILSLVGRKFLPAI